VRSVLLIVLVFCIVLCFPVLLVFVLCLVCPVLLVSLNCSLLIVPPVFSNVHNVIKSKINSIINYTIIYLFIPHTIMMIIITITLVNSKPNPIDTEK
jgi:hypothetical protein